MLETLSFIGERLNNKRITWSVGGSLLLKFHGLVDTPNDIDILVDEDHINSAKDTLSQIGKPEEAIHKEPFRTRFFSTYKIGSFNVDVMGGFAVKHDAGVYRLPFRKSSIVAYENINGVNIPLSSLEDWYILYWLIPGKQEKAALLENHFKINGINCPSLLEKALERPLPREIKDRAKKLLSQRGEMGWK
ncbi:hypothetical protein ACFO3D_18555 [Virgibacillus kekensis]|uniref:Nucleotidyl transferase AbiEii/AbiGii toxin family protein n=1 Tax=Virgibacillus kekensis TaxID=202261 RepID=A0ABV9DNH3_9BACI